MKSELRDFILEYLPELIEGSAAIFAGAGLSVPAGYVDWKALLRPLSKDLKLNIELENDLIAFAQFHYNASGKNRHKLHKALLEALSHDVRPTANHEHLVQLPITTYWTTNYDKLIENSLHAAGKIVDVKSSVPQMATTRPNRQVTVYKMHGDIDRPDEAIVTKDDYEKYAKAREPFVTALAGDLVKKTFLFLGFSFTDPNLEHVLAQVRFNFTDNQRQHFAVFRTRSKQPGETDEHFAHHLARQMHVVEDLKRFNVKVLLVDDFGEITEMLAELVNLYRRRTVFVSGSASTFEPWGEDAVRDFAQDLGRELIAKGARLATGLGLGIGDPLFTGALRDVLRQKLNIGDALVLRPFPQSGDPTQLPRLWQEFRQEIISQAGIILFLFGSKFVGDVLQSADGLVKEFEIARNQGVVVIPIGATGYAAKALADLVLAEPDKYIPQLDADARSKFRALSSHTDDLKSLIPSIIELIHILQGKV
jgi:hypothetical protein